MRKQSKNVVLIKVVYFECISVESSVDVTFPRDPNWEQISLLSLSLEETNVFVRRDTSSFVKRHRGNDS